jgi:hypothetical protein
MRLDERPQSASDPVAAPQVGLNRVTSKLLDTAPATANSSPAEASTGRDADAAAPAAAAHADA